MGKRNNLQLWLQHDVTQSFNMLMWYIPVNCYASTCTHAETQKLKLTSQSCSPGMAAYQAVGEKNNQT